MWPVPTATLDLVGDDPEYLNLVEAAALLRTTPRTLRRWVAAGKVPATKLGRQLLFNREAIRQALTTPPED